MLHGKTIITISRQYGSGGREIGRIVAAKLGIDYYDREIINHAIEQSGIAAEFFEENSEQIKNPMRFLFSFSSEASGTDTLPVADRVFLAQSSAIHDAAEKGSCVIIGRCADYVLEGEEDVINIFIHGSIESRIARICVRNSVDSDEAIALIRRIDKERASHYQHYTDRKWSQLENYDLTLASTSLGEEGAAQVIVDYIRRWQDNRDASTSKMAGQAC